MFDAVCNSLRRLFGVSVVSTVAATTWLAATAEPITAKLELNTPGHRGSVQALATDPFTGHVISGGNDKTVRVWSADGDLIETIYPPAVFETDANLTGELQSRRVREGMIYGLDSSGPLSEGGDEPAWIAFGGQTGQTLDGQRVYVYSWHEKKIVHTIKQPGMGNIIVDVAFSDDGARLAVSSTRGGVWVWSTATWSLSKRLTQCQVRTGSIAWLSDGGLIQTCNDGRIIRYGPDLEMTASSTPDSEELGTPNTLSVNETQNKVAVGYKSSSGQTPFVLILGLDDLTVEARPSTRPDYGRASENNRRQLREEFQQVSWSRDGNYLYASGNYGLMGNAARVRIRKWATGQWDQFEDYPAGQNRVRRLEPHGESGIAYSDLDGLVGALSVVEADNWKNEPSAMEFRRAYTDTPMLVSQDGTQVIVPTGLGAGPLLTINTSNLEVELVGRGITDTGDLDPPNYTGQGLNLSGWEPPFVCGGSAQTINGNLIDRYGFEKCSFSAAVAPSSPELAVWSTGYRLVGAAVDPSNSWVGDRAIPGGAWRLNASGDGRYIVAAAADGFIRWYHTGDGSPALTVYANHLGDWVAWTPEGYYAATPNGERLLAWRIKEGKDVGDRIVPIDRMRQEYRNPSAVRSALTGTDTGQAFRGAGEPVLPDVSKLPPEVTVISVSPMEDNPGQALVRYTVDASSTAENDIQITVRADQRIIDSPTTVTSRSTSGVRELVVDLLPGEDEITLIARSGDRISTPRSRRVTASAIAEVQKPKGDLWAILVGVSEYDPNEFTRLQYTDDDAANFADILEKQVERGQFNAAHIALLDGKDHTRLGDMTTSTEPTSGNIKATLAAMARKVGVHDTAIVFFAGHGMQETFGSETTDAAYYLVPEDATEDNIFSTGIEPSTLLSSVGRSKASRKLVFLDACHSGSPDFKDVVQKFSDDESGVFVFSSARFNELSYEDSNLQNGAYTEALLELFGSPPPSRAMFQDPDDKISALEMHVYTKDRVKQLTGKRQVPTFVSPVPMELEDVFAFASDGSE